MKKRRFISLILCGTLIFSIVGCSSGQKESKDKADESGKAEYKITIEPYESDSFEILGSIVRNYLDTSYAESLALVKSPKTSGEDSQMSYVSFKSEYRESFTVRYSENADFSNYKEILYQAKKAARYYYVNFGILLPDTEYYAYVYATKEPDFKSEVFSFKTEDCIVRMINLIDENGKGPRNVRDIGGYAATDNTRIKYGMIYRGGYLNRRYGMDDAYTLTEYGRSIMLNELGIKSEIDLRTSGADDVDTSSTDKVPQTQNQICEDNPYYKFTITQYDLIFNDARSKANIKNIFQTLAKEENYPVYVHCNAGADRTGTICGLIELLLGVSEEDVTRDFELT